MSDELSLDTYILLGNALNYLVNGGSVDLEVGLDASADAVAALYSEIEPLTPQQIMPAIAALDHGQRALIQRCCLYCLRTMSDDEVGAKLGLSRDVAEDVLAQLFPETAADA